MELRQLNTFVTIAQTLNFTKAADILGYAQSSVTSQIQLLESEFNVKLFERIGKSIYLTPSGEKLLVYAKQILKLSEDAKNSLSSSDELKGTITLGTVESWCTNYFPQVYKKFHEAFPQVEITIKLCCTNDFKKLIKENSIDLGLYIDNNCDEQEYIAEMQRTEPMALMVSPSHPLSAKSIVLPEDLNGEALILTESGCSYRKLLEQMLNQYGVKPRSILDSASNQVIKQLTISGLGITFLPLMAVKDELSKNQLVVLNWNGPSFDIQTQLVYHKDKWISPIMRAFCDTVKEVLDEDNS